MELQTWIYYFLSILILTASPGPMVLLCVTTSIKDGFKYSLYTALGGLTAILGILTLSFSGLGLLVTTSQVLFDIIKYIGAIYLIYLGYKAITSKVEDYKIIQETAVTHKDKIGLFFKGFLVGASNPKAILFFIALLPQFIDSNSPLLVQYIILATTFAIPEIFWLVVYSYLGAKSSKWFLAHGRAKFFNRITGGVFIGAGLLLSTTSRN
ncbi:MAG TPA: LysE family translocator [Nitratifractor sp.]|jgi:threonine/homoserine/homoserine lactone efflux protein|nr:LysE family translocator [Nitratifractor sp.]